MIATGLVKRYAKGTASDATDAMVIADTVRSHPRPGSNSNGTKTGTASIAIQNTTGVRRLTPTECERLQGLPDGWTRLDAKTPDSRRYSGLGDAVTSTVAQWIGERLIAHG